MSTVPSRVDLLLQYILLVSGEQDEFSERQLGPIHLIKYVYLADLFYAKKHDGSTYTGTEWKFYKFGPWSQSINERIDPALGVIGADKRAFTSDYEEQKDWIRWYLRDERLLQDKEDLLPSAITLRLRRDVLKFGRDTKNLLHYVYGTEPMLSAAPGEYLNFTTVVDDALTDKLVPGSLKMDELSNKRRKQFGERMRGLRTKYKNSQRKSRMLINPVKNAHYDEVYEDGIGWLDDLAGRSFSEGKHIVRFSDEVWRSSTRKGGDVS